MLRAGGDSDSSGGSTDSLHKGGRLGSQFSSRLGSSESLESLGSTLAAAPRPRPRQQQAGHLCRGHAHGLSVASGVSAVSQRHFSLRPAASGGSGHAPAAVPEIVADPAGTEPGIDTRHTLVELNNAVGSVISLIDYSPDWWARDQIELRAGTAPDVAATLIGDLIERRPAWSRVRWICVNGLSMQAISPLADTYGLHPLAVEDMLDVPQRTKMDVYANQVFCCFPLHLLTRSKVKRDKFWRVQSGLRKVIRKVMRLKEPGGAAAAGVTNESSAAAPPPPACPIDGCNGPRRGHRRLSSGSRESASSLAGRLAATQPRTLYEWTRSEEDNGKLTRMPYELLPRSYKEATVSIEQVSMFLTEDTVITFFENSAHRVQAPILERLENRETLLRQTADPAILAQAIVDTCVDLIAPIVGEYGNRLNELHIEALRSPTLAHTRALHMLSTELTILRSTIGSFEPMINSFRTKTVDRQGGAPGAGCRYFGNVVSDTAALYFGDVADHAVQYTKRLAIMSEQAKNMSTLIFNTISIRSSDAVRLLSLVTVVFLPLSFLTGYFGMNFTSFSSLNNDVDYYWAIAAPFSAGLMVLLTYGWAFEKVSEIKHWAGRSWK